MTQEEFKNYCEIAAAIATTLGIPIAVYQLWQAKKQLKEDSKERTTAFEDSFAKEYRDLAATIPTKAFFGGKGSADKFKLSEEEYKASFDEIYHYIDLSNTQTFLYEQGRISEKTWIYWEAGIAWNLSLPTFSQAWSEIARDAPESFDELRRHFPPKKLPTTDSEPHPPCPLDEPCASAVPTNQVPRKPAPVQDAVPMPKPPQTQAQG